MWVRCNFLTTPKLKFKVKRPKKHPKGYPIRPKNIGEKIRKHRLDLGLLQKDVAKSVGVTTDTITNWEKGRYEPGKRFLKKIERFLEIKL